MLEKGITLIISRTKQLLEALLCIYIFKVYFQKVRKMLLYNLSIFVHTSSLYGGDSICTSGRSILHFIPENLNFWGRPAVIMLLKSAAKQRLCLLAATTTAADGINLKSTAARVAMQNAAAVWITSEARRFLCIVKCIMWQIAAGNGIAANTGA